MTNFLKDKNNNLITREEDLFGPSLSKFWIFGAIENGFLSSSLTSAFGD